MLDLDIALELGDSTANNTADADSAAPALEAKSRALSLALEQIESQNSTIATLEREVAQLRTTQPSASDVFSFGFVGSV